jgi:aspartate kinase
MEPVRPVVMKFGGTSVQDAAALRRLLEAVAVEPRPRIVVVSALAGVTDALSDLVDGKTRGATAGEVIHRLLERHIAIIRELVAPPRQRALIERLGERFATIAKSDALPPQGGSDRSASAASGFSRKSAERDAILALGELASSQVVAAVLSAAGMPSSWVDARDVMVTDATHGAARPNTQAIRVSSERYLMPLVQAGRIPVLGGFVGATPRGATTTLGRGGSDYTAALVGAGVRALEVQIWTDVDGVYSADPRVVDRPALVPSLSFHEAYELARFGAKVLHWGTLEPAASDDIPVRVLNARQRGGGGTAVSARPHRGGGTVVGLAHQVEVTVVDVQARGVAGSLGFLQTAMGWLEHDGHGVNVICLSPTRLVVSSPDQRLLDGLITATQAVAKVTVAQNAGLVAVVGDGIVGHAAAWRVVTAAREAGQVDAIVAAQSGDALVCVTARHAAPRVLVQLHQAVFGASEPRLRRRAAEVKRDGTIGSVQAGAGL